MNDNIPTRLGIIGGSGLYQIDGLVDAEWLSVESPFGQLSDQVLLGKLEGIDVAFLPRHGRGHCLSPGEINFRANIDGLKRCGVTDIVSLSAVGSLRDELQPGFFVLVDQFIDRTFKRKSTFFESGLVAHVSMAAPVCSRIGESILTAAATVEGLQVQKGGTYLVMEGPQFSTLAESRLYREWGCDVIGMTNMPEAKLAREAEICYSTVAMVTDYDCWHTQHENVSVETVVEVMDHNSAKARSLVRALAFELMQSRPVCEKGCDRALDNAIMSQLSSNTKESMLKLDAIAGRMINQSPVAF